MRGGLAAALLKVYQLFRGGMVKVSKLIASI